MGDTEIIKNLADSINEIKKGVESIKESQQEIKIKIALIENKITSIEKDFDAINEFKSNFEKHITLSDIVELRKKVDVLEKFKTQSITIFSTVQALIALVMFLISYFKK